MNPNGESSFQFCERLTRSHYENFPIGWFLPRRQKKYIYSLYAFARTADDFSDEALYDGSRLARLEEWQRHLEAAARAEPDPGQPIFVALSETIRTFDLPPSLLADLLTAFRIDVTQKRYPTYRDLEEYCRYSANPIGRLVLILSGYREPHLMELSDKICTGIQLVNHWQDIAVDLKKDRVYLPEEDLQRFHYSLEDLQAQRVNEPFRALMRFEIERTRRLFREGKPLLDAIDRRLRWQVSLMWAGPMAILDRIEAVDYDIFRRRPSLSKRDKIRLFLSHRLTRGVR